MRHASVFAAWCTPSSGLAGRVGALAFGLAAMPGLGNAGVHRHVDPVSGMVVINNIPPAAQAAPPAAQPAVSAQSPSFPSISAKRQQQMDAERRAILQEELGEEQRALAAASARRAASDVLARHIANVASLQRELAGLAGKSNN